MNKVLYRAEAGIVEIDFSPGLTSGSHQAVLPGAAKGYIGLRRSLAKGKIHCVPLFYEGKALPGLAQLSRVSVGERNDVKTDHYDLVADYLTHSTTWIFSAIQNRGGGFPTSLSLGTVYPSYMSVIANPADDPEDPRVIIWALVYMKVPLGGLSPGLYRIQNKKLTRIGDIQYQILADSNLLVMSCNKQTFWQIRLSPPGTSPAIPGLASNLSSTAPPSSLLPPGYRMKARAQTSIQCR